MKNIVKKYFFLLSLGIMWVIRYKFLKIFFGEFVKSHILILVPRGFDLVVMYVVLRVLSKIYVKPIRFVGVFIKLVAFRKTVLKPRSFACLCKLTKHDIRGGVKIHKMS